MRQLMTIFHYELLMQIKSVRFKALCALAGLLAFGYYTAGVRLQDLPSYGSTMLEFPTIVLYLIATAFTGLFPIGRIRSSGMHPVLMTKPFPTFALLLGQLLAALAALLVPLAILFFPGGFLLRWRYGIDFQPLPVAHVMLFLLVPLFCTVLAVTIWLRTCFKNNLIAIIILALVFAACLIFADRLLTTRSPDGSRVHRFVPMLSYFSEVYWRGRLRVFDLPRVNFLNREEWIDWATSILYCNIFLMLGGYHLRRTEPQRKVLGHYGRRWYHAPTFLRMAGDLKIDPNVSWRHHLMLLAMAGLIFARTIRPMMPADLAARAMAAATGTAKDDPYDSSRFPERKILAVTIHEDRQTMTCDRYVSELTVSARGETSGTMAIVYTFTRAQYDVRSMSLDGRPVKFAVRGVILYIDDRRLDVFRDGGRHRLRVEAARSTARQEEALAGALETVLARGYSFIHKKHVVMDNDEKAGTFDMRVDETWPLRLELIEPQGAQFLSAPVEPATRADGRTVRYTFDVPAARNGLSPIIFAPFHDYEIIEAPLARLKFRMAVPKNNAAIAWQLLEQMQPVLADFYELHALAPAAPIVFISPMDHGENTDLPRNIHRYLNLYRNRSFGLMEHEKTALLLLLQNFETAVLKKVVTGGLKQGSKWDLSAFTNRNLTRGLNHRLNMDRNYQPPDYTPVSAHLDAKTANALSGHTRAECLEIKPDWPVFQMLYLVLGHEKWRAMRAELRAQGTSEPPSEALLREAAEKAAGQSLEWFFEYWLRGGKDLPCYRIESAAARQLPLDEEGNAKYKFKAAVRNLGTGRMPAPLRLTTTRDPIEEKVWIGAGETATWTVVCRDLPKRLAVDPDGWILTKPYWSEQNRIWIGNASEAVKMEAK